MSIKDQIKNVLIEVEDIYGDEIFLNPSRLRNITKDLKSGRDKKGYSFILYYLSSTGAFSRISKLFNSGYVNAIDLAFLSGSLVKNLMDEAFLEKKNATEIISGCIEYYSISSVTPPSNLSSVHNIDYGYIEIASTLSPPRKKRTPMKYKENSDGTLIYQLLWKQSSHPDTGYIVRRSFNRPILDHNDGELLACIMDNEYVDSTVIPGKTPFYAIYAYLDGKMSKKSLTISGSTQVAMVGSLRLKKMGDGRVEIRYSVPKDVYDIKIFRSYDSPAFWGSNEPIKPQSGDISVAYDTDVDQDKEVHYAVICVFKNKKTGSIVHGSAVNASIIT